MCGYPLGSVRPGRRGWCTIRARQASGARADGAPPSLVEPRSGKPPGSEACWIGSAPEPGRNSVQWRVWPGRIAPRRRLAVAADAAPAGVGAGPAVRIRAARRGLAIAAGAGNAAFAARRRAAPMELGVGIGTGVLVGILGAGADAVARPVADVAGVGIGQALHNAFVRRPARAGTKVSCIARTESNTAPLHPLEPIPAGYARDSRIDAYWPLAGRVQTIASHAAANVARSGDHEGMHDIRVERTR